MSGVPDKIMAQSHTSMSCFCTCPRQYEAKYVTREVKFEAGPEAVWGDQVHKALEAYVRDDAPLPSNVAVYKKFGDAIKARPGIKAVEESFGIDKDGVSVGYHHPTAWVRCKIDLVSYNPTYSLAEIIDYKTGKRKNDPTQLRRYAAMVMCHTKTVERVRAGYLWLKDGVLDAPIIYTRDMLPQMLKLDMDVWVQIESAYMTGNFPPKPSGLCNGWCPVTRCEFWRPKRG